MFWKSYPSYVRQLEEEVVRIKVQYDYSNNRTRSDLKDFLTLATVSLSLEQVTHNTTQHTQTLHVTRNICHNNTNDIPSFNT